ncbi:MAG: hypothetical protein Q9225_006363, partial [Loekoesia sp. 1 TL-2023]
ILFPLPERSPFNLSAPIIDEKTFTTFRRSPELRDRLRESLRRMLRFYGFILLSLSTKRREAERGTEEGRYEVQPAPNFREASRHWVTRFDHNHLRITRIIRSCRVLGLEEEAEAFYAALVKVAEERKGTISQKTMMFWRRAAERPLYLAPEDEEDEGEGEEWLYRFEEERRKGDGVDS